MEVTTLMPLGPPSSPPMDFRLRRTKTRTATTASEQKRVTLKASLVKNKYKLDYYFAF